MTIRITTTRAVTALVLALAYVVLAPATPAAADREHQQIMADLRMLQEQTQQLQALMTDLGEALKAVNSRIEDQTSLERKAFADGKVQMDTMSGDIRVVREKVDETNVRLGTITQELESLRQAIPEPGPSRRCPSNTDAGAVPGATPGGAAPPQTAATTPQPNPGVQPQRLFDSSYGDYTTGNYVARGAGIRKLPGIFSQEHARARSAALCRRIALRGRRKTWRRSSPTIASLPTIRDPHRFRTAYYKRGMALRAAGRSRARARVVRSVNQTISRHTTGGPCQATARIGESADQIRCGRTVATTERRTSMGSVNKVILVGNLGRDAELRYTPGGAAVATLNLATTEVFKDREGQKKEDTQWHRVILWGKTAETLQDYLTKGKQIYVEGKLQTRKWKDKDGNDKYTTEVRGDRVVLLSGGGRGDGAGRGEGGGRSTPAAAADDFSHGEPGGSVELTDDDIPF